MRTLRRATASQSNEAVDGVEAVQSLLDSQEPLGTLGRPGRRGVPAQKHQSQRGRAGLGQSTLVERAVQPRFTHFRAQVLTMQGRQPQSDVQPHPEQRWELGVGQVGVEVAVNVEELLLDDVRRVESAPEPRVHPQLDHAPESVAVLLEERRQRLAVAAAKPVDHVGRVAGRLVHVGLHPHYPRASQKPGPRNLE